MFQDKQQAIQQNQRKVGSGEIHTGTVLESACKEKMQDVVENLKKPITHLRWGPKRKSKWQ